MSNIWRRYCLYCLLAAALCTVVYRLIDLNIQDRHFLLKQSHARVLRTVRIPAHRGMIVDRTGYPLAVSVPVDSIWVNPASFRPNINQLKQLADLLNTTSIHILQTVKQRYKKSFVYLKRRISPALAKRIAAMHIPGLFLQREYKRFYSQTEVSAQLLGLTDVDDQGQEGLELAYNHWLSGVAGKKQVLKDRLGHIIANVAIVAKPKEGRQLTLSIDHRIQYLAYRELKSVVSKYHAQAGSCVVLNVKTGEVFAMVNQPSYNPNNRPKKHDNRYRNRAVTDMFEPGSVIKPFNIALALASGKYQADTVIDTRPGWMQIGGYIIRDDANYGVLNLTGVLQKSSNIGAAKIMLSMQPQSYWHVLHQFGFGHRSASGFPGEASGRLALRPVWYPSVVATLSYGYGLAVTTLQLAQAYAIIANHGLKQPITFLKRRQTRPAKLVISQDIAQQLIHMLETVTQKGGTGTRARVKHYRVAGKTGTAYISGTKGYQTNRYMSSFVGLAPVSDPQYVVAVVVRDPKGQHFGGIVAAPVFAKIMSGVLHWFNVKSDG